MKKVYGLLIILVSFVLPLSGYVLYGETNSDTKILVKGNNMFALEMYAKLKNNNDGNLLFSPYSISTALAMTYAGAKGNTQTQMAKVLHFDSLTQESLHPAFKDLIAETQSENKNYKLNIADALWGQKGYKFLNNFLELTKTNYSAGFKEVDFENEEIARNTINNWVEEKTGNKIKELIQKGVLAGNTHLVLTNAIYFKGGWVNPFDKKETEKSPFYIKSDKEIQVSMMYKKSEFKYMETDKFQAIELPYKGDNLSMVVLLPNKIDSLSELENSISSDSLSMWIQELQSQQVKVFFPQFKTTEEFSLAEILKSMGMPDAFLFGIADFSGMNGKKDLFISAVLHKAFIDVTEEGTEAAAATAVAMTLGMGRPAPMPQIPIFRADHPFIFLIRDNRSGSILFLGRLVNPLE